MRRIPGLQEIRAMNQLTEESKLITKINQNYSGSAKTVLKILYYVFLVFLFDFGKTPSEESINNRADSIRIKEKEKNDERLQELTKMEKYMGKYSR